TWPDGHETKGIERHIEDLKALFVFAPDLKIKVHPIRFGSGTWTAVTGVMSGTFTKPMPIPDGKSISPTGKHFALTMVTIGHWKGATMDHEWLFWDNQDFMNQIGLGKSWLSQNSHSRSEEHTSELQSRGHLVCRLLLEKKKNTKRNPQGLKEET